MKLSSRIVALILVPCLVADSSAASILATGLNPNLGNFGPKESIQDYFADQALANVALDARQLLSRFPQRVTFGSLSHRISGVWDFIVYNTGEALRLTARMAASAGGVGGASFGKRPKPAISPQPRMMDANRFGPMLEDLLQSIGKSRREYNNMALDADDIYQTCRRLYEDLSFLLTVCNPYAVMDEADFWGAVILALRLESEKTADSEVRLGVLWNRIYREIFRQIAAQYRLPSSILRKELELFRASPFYSRDRETFTMEDRGDLRVWLEQKANPRRSRFLQKTLQISFPNNLGAASFLATTPFSEGPQGLDPMDQPTFKTIVASVLRELTPREENVIKRRFGLGEYELQTLEEVGQVFAVTRERIREIEAKALRKLRHPSRVRKLVNFMPDPRTADRVRLAHALALRLWQGGLVFPFAEMVASALFRASPFILERLRHYGVLQGSDLEALYDPDPKKSVNARILARRLLEMEADDIGISIGILEEIADRLGNFVASLPPPAIQNGLEKPRMWVLGGPPYQLHHLGNPGDQSPNETPPAAAPPADVSNSKLTQILQESAETFQGIARIPELQEKFPGTVLWTDWAESNQALLQHYVILSAVPNAQSIEKDPDYDLGYGTLEFDARLQKFVERPAQRLVRTILPFGGEPRQSNAYGPYVKAVTWTKDGNQYLTPLTLEDYEVLNDHPAAVALPAAPTREFYALVRPLTTADREAIMRQVAVGSPTIDVQIGSEEKFPLTSINLEVTLGLLNRADQVDIRRESINGPIETIVVPTMGHAGPHITGDFLKKSGRKRVITHESVKHALADLYKELHRVPRLFEVATRLMVTYASLRTQLSALGLSYRELIKEFSLGSIPQINSTDEREDHELFVRISGRQIYEFQTNIPEGEQRFGLINLLLTNRHLGIRRILHSGLEAPNRLLIQYSPEGPVPIAFLFSGFRATWNPSQAFIVHYHLIDQGTSLSIELKSKLQEYFEEIYPKEKQVVLLSAHLPIQTTRVNVVQLLKKRWLITVRRPPSSDSAAAPKSSRSSSERGHDLSIQTLEVPDNIWVAMAELFQTGDNVVFKWVGEQLLRLSPKLKNGRALDLFSSNNSGPIEGLIASGLTQEVHMVSDGMELLRTVIQDISQLKGKVTLAQMKVEDLGTKYVANSVGVAVINQLSFTSSANRPNSSELILMGAEHAYETLQPAGWLVIRSEEQDREGVEQKIAELKKIGYTNIRWAYALSWKAFRPGYATSVGDHGLSLIFAQKPSTPRAAAPPASHDDKGTKGPSDIEQQPVVSPRPSVSPSLSRDVETKPAAAQGTPPEGTANPWKKLLMIPLAAIGLTLAGGIVASLLAPYAEAIPQFASFPGQESIFYQPQIVQDHTTFYLWGVCLGIAFTLLVYNLLARRMHTALVPIPVTDSFAVLLSDLPSKNPSLRNASFPLPLAAPVRGPIGGMSLDDYDDRDLRRSEVPLPMTHEEIARHERVSLFQLEEQIQKHKPAQDLKPIRLFPDIKAGPEERGINALIVDIDRSRAAARSSEKPSTQHGLGDKFRRRAA